MLLLCRLATRFLARTETFLCDLVHKGEHCLAAPPSLVPPEEVYRYWIKSRRTMKSQFGAALALLNHKQQDRREFFSLAFQAATGWKSHLQNSFWKKKKFKLKQLFHSDHSATCCCTVRRQKLLYLCVWPIFMRPRKISTTSVFKLYKPSKMK